MSPRLIVNYHHFTVDRRSNLHGALNYKFADFECDLQKIAAWSRVHRTNEKQIQLTMDDGYHSQWIAAQQVLMPLEIKGLFFPILNRVGKSDFMNWSQLRDLSQQGHGIGVHGTTHCRLPFLDKQAFYKEIQFSKMTFEDRIGIEMKDFSLPYGVYTTAIVKQILEAGFKRVYTTRSLFNQNTTSPLVHRFNVLHSTDVNNLLSALEREQYVLLKRAIPSMIANGLNYLHSLSNLKKVANNQ